MYFWIARWIFLLWDALLVAWAVAIMTSKPSAQSQDSEFHLLQIGIQVLGLWMIFGSPFLLRKTIFADRLLPAHTDVAVLGLLLTVAGMLLTAWARILIGSHKKNAVVPRRGNVFVRKGPYRMARHPIYTGLIFATLGTAIVFLRAECFAGALLVAVGFWFKLRSDERLMLQQFGEEYARYRNEVRALIPFIL